MDEILTGIVIKKNSFSRNVDHHLITVIADRAEKGAFPSGDGFVCRREVCEHFVYDLGYVLFRNFVIFHLHFP